MKHRIKTCGVCTGTSADAYLFRDGMLTSLVPEDGCGSFRADDVLDGDMVVICSRSLSAALSTDEMEYILANDYEPAEGLVERARDNGAGADASAVVILAGEGEFAPGLADAPDDDGRFDAWV